MQRVSTDRKEVPKILRLYTRPGCGLCEQLVQQLEGAGLLERMQLRQVAVDGDPALSKLYGLRLPVLELAGEVIFEGRPDREVLIPRVRAALGMTP